MSDDTAFGSLHPEDDGEQQGVYIPNQGTLAEMIESGDLRIHTDKDGLVFVALADIVLIATQQMMMNSNSNSLMANIAGQVIREAMEWLPGLLNYIVDSQELTETVGIPKEWVNAD